MFVPHEISKQSDVIPFLQEILSEPVTERMWIDHCFV